MCARVRTCLRARVRVCVRAARARGHACARESHALPSLETGTPAPPRMPTVSLVGPLQLRLVWLPPDGGEPEGGYRIIAIDNERRLIAHSLIVAPSVTSFALNNEAAQQFSPTTGYTGAPTDPVLNIAPGHSYRLFIASVDAEGLAGAPGASLTVARMCLP